MSWKKSMMARATRIALVWVMGAAGVEAADQVVTNNNDSGVGSLRQAMIDVTAGGTITFDDDYTITLSSDLPDVDKDITIVGRGSEATVVDGAGSYTAFEVTSTGVLSLSRLKITNATDIECMNDLNLDGVTITGCTGDAGAVYSASSGAQITVENSLIHGNTGTYRGGAFCCLAGTWVIKNTTLFNNQGDQYGGAIYMAGPSTVTVDSCTIVGNTTGGTGIGGGIRLFAGGLTIRNTILANNQDSFGDNDYSYGGGTLIDNGYNLVEITSDAAPNGFTNANNNNIVGTDPTGLAGALSYEGGWTKVLKITAGTFTGGNYGSTAETRDQRGYYRKSTEITRGAYQYDGIVAKKSTDGWDAGYTSIADANGSATGGDTIDVIDAVILEVATSLTKDLTFNGQGESSTIIQAGETRASASDRVFTVFGGNVVLADMTIRHGNVTGSGGGCVYAALGSLTASNVTFTTSQSDTDGGGLDLGVTTTLTDCTITNNAVTNAASSALGGGIYASGGTLTLDGCTIDNNTATGTGEDAGGGGIYADTTFVLNNCTIADNVASSNTGVYGAGGVIDTAGEGTLVNATISGNSTAGIAGTKRGGGLYNDNNAYLANTIVANNTASTGSSIYTNTGDSTSVYYSWYTDAAGDAIATQATAPNVTAAWNSDLGSLADNGGPTRTMAVVADTTPSGNGEYVYYNGVDGYYIQGNDSTYYKVATYASFVPGDPGSDQIAVDQMNSARGVPLTIGAYQAPAIPPTKVVLTGPPTLVTGTIGLFTLSSLDNADVARDVTTNTTFDLSSNSSGTAAFYSDAAGTAAITQVTIPTGSNAVTFYYRDDDLGSIPIITATRASGMSLGSGSASVRICGRNGVNFNGTDQYVVTADGPDLATAKTFTVECWAKRDSTGTSDVMFGQGSTNIDRECFYFGMTAGDEFFAAMISPGSVVKSAGTYTDLGWHHYAVSYDNTTMIGYRDGAEVFNGTLGGADYAPVSNRISLGVGPWSLSTFPFDGSIDEVRVWDDLRTPAEIRANMHRELLGNEAGLVAYYRLGFGSGITAYDSMAGGNNGTLTNGPTWQTSGAFARAGNGLDFDGTDDYVEADSVCVTLNNSTTLTLETWFKPAAVDIDQYFLAFNENNRDNNIQLGVSAGDARLKVMRDGSTVSGSVLTAGRWYHVALTVAADDSATVYLDGVADIIANINERPASNGLFSIGQEWDGGGASNFAQGVIDEVRVWSVARSAQEIRENMCRTLSGDEPGLVAYYRCDQPAVAGMTTLYDLSPNGNNGTLTNMDPATDWVTSAAFNTWIGAVSTDWATDANWSRAAVPVAADNLGIPDYSGYANGLQPVVAGSGSGYHMVVNTNASLTFASDLALGGNLFLPENVDVESYTLDVGGRLTNTAELRISTGTVDVDGPFDGGTGSVVFDGAGTGTLELGSTYDLGTFTPSQSTVTFDGTSAQTITGTPTFYNLTIANAAGVDASGAGSLTVTNQFSANTGTFTGAGDHHHVAIGAGGTMALSDNITVSGDWGCTGTLTPNSRTVTMDGGSDQAITGATAFYDLTSTNAGTVDASGATSVQVTHLLWPAAGRVLGAFDADDVLIAGGATLELSGNSTVSGNWTNNGTFTHGDNEVELDGTGQALSGDTTFHTLRKTVGAADTLTFAAGSTTTITDTLELSGAAGQLLALVSASPGTRWNIDPPDSPGGTRTLAYLDVKDSNNADTTAIDVSGQNCTNSGNNVNWIFDAATVTTQAVTGITGTTATGNGNVTALGDPPATQHGVCWSTSSSPDITDSKTAEGAPGSTGAFTSNITGLSPGATYYVRAYLTTSTGTVYGSEVQFTTKAPPTLSTAEVTGIGGTSATCGGEITDNGSDPVTARGVCWDRSPVPTVADDTTSDGTGTGTFSSSITGLQPGVTYYVRAYATNNASTSYGDEKSFTTLVILPTLTTADVINVTETRATCGGEITSVGGGTITARGVCWNTAGTPTIDDDFTSNGTGIGSFTSNLTNLEPGTTYFVRAYATNSAGTGYGAEQFFTTPSILPTVTTYEAITITDTTAQAGGEVVTDGGEEVTARGVCWNTVGSPTITDNATSDGTGVGSFTSSITGLVPGASYYLRAYATNVNGTAYGNEVTFGAQAALPSVVTGAMADVSDRSAVGSGEVVDDGGAAVTGRGFCWNTTGAPTLADYTSSHGSGLGTFTGNIEDLSPGVTYYVRAYAVNSAGTSYGDEVAFTTAAVSPAVITADVTDVTRVTATGGGSVTDDGGSTVTAHGVCWNTTGSPTLADQATNDGAGIGSYSSSLTGLEPGVQYYVRAYATNGMGTGYGAEVSFRTIAVLPVVLTAEVSDVTARSAVGGGEVIDDGGQPVTARGVCWNTAGSPTVADSSSSNGTGLGVFTSALTSLEPGVTYFVRAYATTGAGTSYGDELSFTTVASLPTVQTAAITGITQTAATGGGDVTDEGGAPVTARGVCWNAVGLPTVADDATSEGAGAGPFTSTLDDLDPGATYYVRAYATNAVGTGYGDEVTFNTNGLLPAVLTLEPVDITTTSANVGGDVTDDGGAEVTVRGICWNTASLPTIADNVLELGSGVGVYEGEITGLTPGATYYVRAYATNAVGTVYGEELSFTTGSSDEPGDGDDDPGQGTGDDDDDPGDDDPAVGTPDLQVEIVAGEQSAGVGEDISFAVDVTNLGNGQATNVILRFPLPPNTEFVGVWLVAGEVQQSMPLNAYVEGDEIVVELGDVLPAEDLKLQVVVKATAVGAVSLEAQVASDEQPEPVTAQAGAEVEVDNVYWEVIEQREPPCSCGLFGAVAPALLCFGLLGLKRRRYRD